MHDGFGRKRDAKGKTKVSAERHHSEATHPRQTHTNSYWRSRALHKGIFAPCSPKSILIMSCIVINKMHYIIWSV